MDQPIAIRDLPQQPIVSIRQCHAAADLPRFFGFAFGELVCRLRVLGVTPAGAPFAIYHEFGPDEVDVEACLPVGRAVSSVGSIGARVLPPVTVATTLHVGPYETLGVAYAALADWIDVHGREASGPVRERYLIGPGDQAAPTEYRTEIEQPVAPARVLVAG